MKNEMAEGFANIHFLVVRYGWAAIERELLQRGTTFLCYDGDTR